MQIDSFFLHPLLLEVEPVDLSPAPLGLQLAIALQDQVDALLQFLQFVSTALFQLLQFPLHLCQFVVEEGDLILLVIDEGGQRRISFCEDLQLQSQLFYFRVDGVAKIGHRIVFFRTDHQ